MLDHERIGPVEKFRLARTLLGKGRYFTACYRVDGLMVDSGCRHTVDELLAALEPGPVHTIVNTHTHEDHIAGNAASQRRWGTSVLGHELAVPILRDTRKMGHIHAYRRVMWGIPESCRADVVPGLVETEHHRFRVIHTPGHSPDHICLYEPNQGWLFSGDLFNSGRDRALRTNCRMWEQIESLETLAALETSVVFPGSGSVRHDPRPLLEAKIAYLTETGEKVLDLHRKGYSVQRIRKMLFGNRLLLEYLALGDFSGAAMVRSYVETAHLRRG